MSRIASPWSRTSSEAGEHASKYTIQQLRRSPRVAVALWIVLAFAVWNVVFDRILVLAGRQYGTAAAIAVRDGHDYIHIDDWMGPAIVHGVRVASLVALAIALFGLIAVAIASRLDRRRETEPR